jgi:gamma-glutamyl-gamma-aminobutyrate hydrolase PuuD
MFKNKPVFLTTGPSLYSPQIQRLVEKYFGGIAVYVNNYDKDALDYFINQADFLIGGGGVDVFPGFLGQNVLHNEGYSKFNLRRDIAEKYLIESAIKHKIPSLLICRSFQLAMSAIFGFHLIPDLGGNIAHSRGEIQIDYENGEFLHLIECIGEYKEIYFHREGSFSAHHQGIYFSDKMKQKNGVNVVGIANTSTDRERNNQIVEIAESEECKLVMCQMHPEVDWEYGNIVSNKVLERFKSFID